MDDRKWPGVKETSGRFHDAQVERQQPAPPISLCELTSPTHSCPSEWHEGVVHARNPIHKPSRPKEGAARLRGAAMIQPDGASGDCTKWLVLLFKALKAIADKVHRRFETVNLLVEIRGDMPRV